MRTFGGRFAVVVSFLVAGVSRAEAQQSKVRLSTDKPVYTKGGADPVKIFLKNEGLQPVQLSNPSPWSIRLGNSLVHSHITPQIIAVLQPGETKIWSWNKKNTGGKIVPPGTYTVRVGTIFDGNGAYELKHDVALTASGKIAASSSFPLAIGNEWNFVSGPSQGAPAGLSEQVRVAQKIGKWFLVQNLVEKNRWSVVAGGFKPTLITAESPLPTQSLYELFRFNRPVGHAYKITLDYQIVTVTVLAKKETVITPAGTFKNCYRVAFKYNTEEFLSSWYTSFAFAPGIGLVQYSMWAGSGKTFNLRRAKLKGSDGKVYLIGPNN